MARNTQTLFHIWPFLQKLAGSLSSSMSGKACVPEFLRLGLYWRYYFPHRCVSRHKHRHRLSCAEGTQYKKLLTRLRHGVLTYPEHSNSSVQGLSHAPETLSFWGGTGLLSWRCSLYAHAKPHPAPTLKPMVNVFSKSDLLITRVWEQSPDHGKEVLSALMLESSDVPPHGINDVDSLDNNAEHYIVPDRWNV